MTGICFHYEDNDIDVFSGRADALDAWNYAILAAGDIDEVVIVNKTEQDVSFNQKFNVRVMESLEEFIEYAAGARVVYVTAPGEAEGATPLWQFDHAEVDYYVFGSTADRLPRGDITIPTAGATVLHPVHAASVVLAHRFGG